MSSRSVIGYQFEIEDFSTLQYVNKQLFGDGTHLTPDQRRDLANMLFIVLGKAIPVYDEE